MNEYSKEKSITHFATGTTRATWHRAISIVVNFIAHSSFRSIHVLVVVSFQHGEQHGHPKPQRIRPVRKNSIFFYLYLSVRMSK